MRRGFQPPADLWGNVGILVTRMYDRPFDKIRVLGDRILLVGCGRVYEIVGFRQLLLVNPPLQIMGIFDVFIIDNPGLFLKLKLSPDRSGESQIYSTIQGLKQGVQALNSSSLNQRLISSFAVSTASEP